MTQLSIAFGKTEDEILKEMTYEIEIINSTIMSWIKKCSNNDSLKAKSELASTSSASENETTTLVQEDSRGDRKRSAEVESKEKQETVSTFVAPYLLSSSSYTQGHFEEIRRQQLVKKDPQVESKKAKGNKCIIS